MKNNKDKYKEYCDKETEMPVFLTHGWLSTVAAHSDWDVAMVEKGGELFAAIPYVITRKWGFKIISMPSLTPYLGVWMKYPEGQKEGTRLSYEKEIMFELIDEFPDFSHFRQNFLPNLTNGLPFHWRGYKQRLRYTYILDKLDDLGIVFEGLQQNIRRQIKKAEKNIKVIDSEDVRKLFKFKKLSYYKSELNLPFGEDHVQRIFQYCKDNRCGKILSAIDDQQRVHAMVLLVWDKHSCYYLFGASNPEFKNSGAMSLLMWSSIEFAAKSGISFNFEGSMIESVERFFRSFGARQVPYLQLEKTNSSLYKLIQFFKRA